MISILDYGAGNVGSVIRMIEKAGGTGHSISSAQEILEAKKLIIPGVGAFDYGMNQLKSRQLIDALHQVKAIGTTPVLGLCLGMHLMCKGSEEGVEPGLKWVDAEVLKFKKEELGGLKVPSMGWNTVRIVKDNPLITEHTPENRFYFVHSFYVHCNNPSDVIAYSHYGVDLVSAFRHGHIFGVQFHPEKSHRFGLEVIRHFVNL